MILKKIHYVWVGHSPKPPLVKECLTTWKKKLPDYEIIEWSESNFSMHENRYLEEVYRIKKWALVSSYIYAYAIYGQGGIYLDIDVRVLKKSDPPLKSQVFIGFENNNYLSVVIFGIEVYHPLMKNILDYYQDKEFTFDKSNQMAGVNSLPVIDILKKKYGPKTDNCKQFLKDGVHVYPDGFLYSPSKDSYSIHLFAGIWIDGQQLAG